MRKNHLPSPDVNTLMQPQDTISLCSKGSELAHAHPDSSAKLLSSWAASSTYWYCLGFFPLWTQDLALHLVDPASPFLQAVRVLTDGSMTFWCTSQFTQFCITNKFAPSSKSLMEMFNRTGSSSSSGYTTSCQTPAGSLNSGNY